MSLIEKKVLSDEAGFEERMRQAEQEAGIPPDEEFYAEFGVEHPVADETGRVPASREPEAETVEAVEGQVAETPDTQAGEPEPETEQPDPLAELNKKVGQLINENADLRRELANKPDPTEQIQSWLAEQQEQQRYSPDQFEHLLENDPATATMVAHQRGDQLGYARAWQAWNDVAPGAPQIWADNQNLRAQLQEFQQTIGQQIAPARAAIGVQEQQQAMSAVAARHPDFNDVMGTMTEDDLRSLRETQPVIARVLEEGLTGDRQAKEGVYEALYRWRKAEQTDRLVQAAREIPAQQAEEARQAKLDAHVGSSATTAPAPVEETEAERQVRVWREQNPTLRDAWAGQDSRRR